MAVMGYIKRWYMTPNICLLWGPGCLSLVVFMDSKAILACGTNVVYQGNKRKRYFWK